MKKIALNLILLFTLTYSFSQNSLESNPKENVNSDFIEYNKLMVNQDFENAMEFMLPEFFQIIPKTQMIILMKQVYNNPDMEYKMGNPKNIEIGEIFKIENKSYSEINYSYDIQMKYLNLEKSEDEEKNKLNQNLIKLTLEKTFGSGNVVFNETTEFYEINAIKKAVGISENGIDNWKFLIIDKKQKFILEKILPKEITDKI